MAFHDSQHLLCFSSSLTENVYDSNVCLVIPTLIPAGGLLTSMSPLSILSSSISVTFKKVGYTLYPVLALASTNAILFYLANFCPSS